MPVLPAWLNSRGVRVKKGEVKVEPNYTEEIQVNDKKKEYTLWDFVIAIVLGAFSLFFIISSYMMPAYGETIYARPGTVPLIVGTALLFLSIMLIVKCLKENKISLLWGEIIELAKFNEAHRFIVITITTLIYIAVLDSTNIHFIILTAIFLWVLFVYFKVSLLVSTILSIVTAAAIYGFFTQIFTVPMP